MCQGPKEREEADEFWAQRGGQSDCGRGERWEMRWRKSEATLSDGGWQGSASSEDQEKRRRKEAGGSKAEMLRAPSEHPPGNGEARPGPGCRAGRLQEVINKRRQPGAKGAQRKAGAVLIGEKK